jgi:hypothetical protein
MELDGRSNFGKARVLSGYDFNASTTTVDLQSGDVADLPTPSTDGDYNLVVWNSTDYTDSHDDPNREIVRVTGISSNTLTITRGQEGGGAKSHNTSGKRYTMLLGVTAKVLDDIESRAGLVAFRVHKITSQSIATGAAQTVTFDTEGYDESADFNIGSNKFVAPRAMILDAVASVKFGATEDGKVFILELVNNTTTTAQSAVRAAGTGSLTVTVHDKIKLSTSDEVTVEAQHSATAAKVVDEGVESSYFTGHEIKRV